MSLAGTGDKAAKLRKKETMKWKGQEAQRLILQVLVQWHSWLSNRAASVEEWSLVPHWCKRAPEWIDKRWSAGDVDYFLRHKRNIRSLRETVDHLNMSVTNNDLNLPDLRLLLASLEELEELLDE